MLLKEITRTQTLFLNSLIGNNRKRYILFGFGMQLCRQYREVKAMEMKFSEYISRFCVCSRDFFDWASHNFFTFLIFPRRFNFEQCMLMYCEAHTSIMPMTTVVR